MLQAVSTSPAHDANTLLTTASSVSSVIAARAKSDNKKHILIAASGSVATIKLPLIVSALGRHHDAVSIRIVLTSSAASFLAGQAEEQPTVDSLRRHPAVDGVHLDNDEWGPEPWRRGQGIMHIELRRWADLLLVAPLSANTMAKICAGACDNLLTSVIRAWDTDGSVDGKRKRILVAPAMNTAMWRHPVTKMHIGFLEGEWGVNNPELADDHKANTLGGWFEVLRPVEKTLACGDVGDGAMMDWSDIVDVVLKRLAVQ